MTTVRVSRRHRLLWLLLVPTGLRAGCSGTNEVEIGETASVTLGSTGEELPFDVTVASFDLAPAAVLESFEDEGEVYFAKVEFTYTGDPVESMPSVFHQVFSALDDGSFLSSTFIGLSECSGIPEESDWEESLSAGKMVSACVPLSDDEGLEVTGVYVGDNDLESGTVWKR